MFYSAGTQQGGQILKYLTNANKYPPLFFKSSRRGRTNLCVPGDWKMSGMFHYN